MASTAAARLSCPALLILLILLIRRAASSGVHACHAPYGTYVACVTGEQLRLACIAVATATVARAAAVAIAAVSEPAAAAAAATTDHRGVISGISRNLGFGTRRGLGGGLRVPGPSATLLLARDSPLLLRAQGARAAAAGRHAFRADATGVERASQPAQRRGAPARRGDDARAARHRLRSVASRRHERRRQVHVDAPQVPRGLAAEGRRQPRQEPRHAGRRAGGARLTR